MWDLLDAELEKLRGGQVLLLGDMNARLWSRQPGEEDVIGRNMLQTLDWREGEDADGDLNRAALQTHPTCLLYTSPSPRDS